jgi:co-chaperonin GroES (HSP10)
MSVALPENLIEASKQIRVLRDRVLVKPVPYVHPVLATPGMEIQKGIVVAVGYGRRQKRKVEFRQSMPDEPILGPTGKPAKFAKTASSGRVLYFEDGDETGRILPMQVKQGDVVEFSFRNTETVDFDRIAQFYSLQLGPLMFVWQRAIYSIDTEEDMEKICSEALLWQQSAGYDRHGNFMSGAESWNRV